jgi:cytochrome c biogenesis protein CcmG/thiol:disulfide interchange protein DsbE
VILRAAQVLALGLVAALLGVLVWRVVRHDPGSALVSEIAKGTKPAAPGFSLQPIWPDAVGASPRLAAAVRRGRVTVADLAGRPTIVNVFASWCGPCKDEAPILAAASRRYTGRIQFIGLDYHDFESDGRALLRRYGSDYVALHDGDGNVSNRWGVTGVPETYVLDPTGHIVAHVASAVGKRELQPLIAAALASG